MSLSWRLLNRSEHASIFTIYSLLIKLLLILIIGNLKVAIELLQISSRLSIFLMIVLPLGRILSRLWVVVWRGLKLVLLHLRISLRDHGLSSVWRRPGIRGLSFLQ